MAGFSVPLVRYFYQGQVAANAQVTAYQSGTTTPVPVYSDAALSVPLTNPVPCDSNGEAVFFVGSNVALRLYATTSGGTLIRDIDPVYPVPALIGPLTHGQCRLVKSGANLLLQPLNGNKLIVNGSIQTVTSPTLAATGLTAGTTYYVYAYMNNGTMTLEASTTGHSADANGVEVKTGDATRTLVGMARVVTGPAWQDTPAQRFVASWFNRKPTHLANPFNADQTTASTTYVELNSLFRCEFLSWGDAVRASVTGSATNATGSTGLYTLLGLDGIPSPPAVVLTGVTAPNFAVNQAVSADPVPAEGYHYLTIGGAVSGGTGKWFGGNEYATGVRATLNI